MKTTTKRVLAILLTALMMFSVVTVGISSVSAATDTTVYFVNSWNWNDVRCYGYNDYASDGTFPGNSATLVDTVEGYGIYSYDVTVYTTISFNDSTTYNKTSNLNATDLYGKYYEPITATVYNTAEEALIAAGLIEAPKFEAGATLYLQPACWNSNGARFAAYFFNSTGDKAWESAEVMSTDTSVYSVTVPEGEWTNVIFTRLNGSTTENAWSNVWNQTADLAVDGTNDCYVITDWSTGNWTKYTEKVVYFVNTIGWETVYGYGWTDGIGGTTAWPGKEATLVDAENGVYSFNPGDRKTVLFNNNTENTSFMTCTDVYGKYIEPITNTYYNTVEEAWAASGVTVTTAATTTATTEATEATTEATVATTEATVATTEATEATTEISEFAGKKYYLVPNEWAIDGARFAAYFFKYGYTGVWEDMVDSNGDGIYEVVVPYGNYNQVIFYRMDGSTTENVEANAWNKSNQTFLEYGNCYTISLPWSKYDPGDWSTYTEPATEATTSTEAAEATNVVYFVNTKNWEAVYGYGYRTGYGSDMAWPGKEATLVDAENGVYSYAFGSYDEALFNNNDENTSFMSVADVVGKYIEPKTNTYYNTVEEAWAAANSYVEPVNFVAGDTLYMVPNCNWIHNGTARFAAYFYNTNGESVWLSLEEVDPNTYDYMLTIPEGNWSNVIFCRMDGATTVNAWYNVWNQTGDIAWDGTSNCYYINEYSWTEGTWGTYTIERCYFVNTLGWSAVGARCWTYGSYETSTTVECTLVDAENGVYYFNPGSAYYIQFNDNDTNGECTYRLFSNNGFGKYYDPTTKAYYTTAQEAIDAAAAASTEATEATEATQATTSGSDSSYSNGEDNTTATEGNTDSVVVVPDNTETKCDEHTYDDGKVTKKATYFAKGEKVYTCTECGETKVVKVAKLKLKTPTVKVTASKKKVTVKYTKVKGATGFQVKYTVKGKTVTKTFTAKKTVSKVLKNLKKGTCKVQVRAFVKNGTKTAYSNWTKVKSVKVK